MVLDRFFLFVFTIASIGGTLTILAEAPALYDTTKAIDMQYSSITHRQYLPPNQHSTEPSV